MSKIKRRLRRLDDTAQLTQLEIEALAALLVDHNTLLGSHTTQLGDAYAILRTLLAHLAPLQQRIRDLECCVAALQAGDPLPPQLPVVETKH